MPLANAYIEQLPLFLSKVCQAILDNDADVVAIVQFGSSIYAPFSALDVDIFVVTKKRKDYGVYLDATVDVPFPVDVIPLEADGKINRELASAIKGASRLLYGDAEIVERMVKDMPVPTYDEARELLLNADEDMQAAPNEPTSLRQESRYRTAFNTLFDAARLAAMAFLNTEETRWGQLRGQLPPPYDGRFRQIIDTLHVEYFYLRHIPLVSVSTEYQHWRDIVSQFINDLEFQVGI